MKTTTAAMQTHLGQEVTALATCWIIDREDGITKRFTDHDQDIPVGGDIYSSIGAYKRTASETTDTLSVDNLDIEGISNELALPRDDLILGTYDNATIRVFMTSWDGTDTGELKLRRGFFGQVQTLPNGTFSVELRGIFQHLAHTYTKLYTATCLYDLGEADCGVPIDPPFVQRSTAYLLGDHVSADPIFTGSPVKAGDVFKLPIIGPSFEGLAGNLSNSIGWYSLSGASLVLGVPDPEGAKDGSDAIKGGAAFANQPNPITRTDISFTAPDIIGTTAGDFTALLSSGDTFVVSGTASNDGTYVVDTVAALQITTIEQTIAAETAGVSFTLTRRAADGTISQDVDLLAAGVTAANIDAGNVFISLFGWRIGDNAHTGQLVFHNLDSRLNVIDTIYDSTAETLDVTDGWVRRGGYEIPVPIPQQTNPTFGTDISFTAPDIIDYNPTVGTDISFTAPNIMDSGASAFGDLQIGNSITVSGSTSNDGTYVVDTASAAQITFIEQTIVAEVIGATITVSRDNPFGSLVSQDDFSVAGSASNDANYKVDTITATRITTIEQTIVTEVAGAGVTLTELKFTRFVRISYSVVGTDADQYLDNVYGWLIDTNGSARLTYTKADVMFRALNDGTTSATAPSEGYSYVLCDFSRDGGVTWFTDISWTRAGEVTSSTGNRIFDITVLEGRGFTGWYDGGLITWETGKNAGASMEIKSWLSPGPIINPEFRVKLTTGTDEPTDSFRGDMLHVDWGAGTAGVGYTPSSAFGSADTLFVWDLASLSVTKEIDLTLTGPLGGGYEFFGLDPDTGYLVGAQQGTSPDTHHQYVFDPVTEVAITLIENFASPGEWLYRFDTTYAFLKHAGGASAVLSYSTTDVRASTMPGLVTKNNFSKAGYQAGWISASKAGEAYGFWRNADVMLVQKYVIQTDGTVTETQVGVISAWEVGPGTFRHTSNRPRPIYDPVNDSIHFHVEMTGDGGGEGRSIGWSEANGVIYSTFIAFSGNQIAMSQSYNVIGTSGQHCFDVETFDRVFCIDTLTGELTVRAIQDISSSGNTVWNGDDQALYNFNDNGFFNGIMEVRKPLVEGTRLGTIELYLSMPFNVEPGDLFAIYPGCDKTRISCAVIFDNIKEMFGAPDIPGQDAILSVPDAK